MCDGSVHVNCTAGWQWNAASGECVQCTCGDATADTTAAQFARVCTDALDGVCAAGVPTYASYVEDASACGEEAFWDGMGCVRCTAGYCGAHDAIRVPGTCQGDAPYACAPCGTDCARGGTGLHYSCPKEGTYPVGALGCHVGNDPALQCLPEATARGVFAPGSAPPDATYASVAHGDCFSCVVTQSRGLGYEVLCWGNDGALPGTDLPLGSSPKALSFLSGSGGLLKNTCADAGTACVPEGAVSVVAGDKFACTLTSLWRVFCWGDNSKGQMGNHESVEYEGPARASVYLGEPSDSPSLAEYRPEAAYAISAMGDVACAIVSGFRVRCWGDNEYGQLGIAKTADGDDHIQYLGTNEERVVNMGQEAAVALIGNGVRARQLAVGRTQVCVLVWKPPDEVAPDSQDSNEGVKCWGKAVGLGYGDNLDRGAVYADMGNSLPYVDLGLTAYDSVSRLVQLDDNARCVILTDARAKCWGVSALLRPATGDTVDAPIPWFEINQIDRFTYITGRRGTACALLPEEPEEPHLFCWDSHSTVTVTRTAQPLNVLSVGYNHGANTAGVTLCSYASTDEDEELYVLLLCGHSESEKTTDAIIVASALSTHALCHVAPSAPPRPRAFIAQECPQWAPLRTPRSVISAGDGHACAVVHNFHIRGAHPRARVQCWGAYTDDVDLGPAPGRYNVFPSNEASVAEVKSGERFSCALLEGSWHLSCWGDNSEGQCGLVSAAYVAYSAPHALAFPAGTTVLSFALGAAHGCALLSDAALYCWGRNSGGQVGARSADDVIAPPRAATVLPAETYALAFSCGSEHTCVWARDGAIVCWGRRGLLGAVLSEGEGENTPVGRASSDTAMPVERTEGVFGGTTFPGHRVVLHAFSRGTCVLLEGGRALACWGTADVIRGDGGASHTLEPVRLDLGLADGSHAIALAGTGEHLCAHVVESALTDAPHVLVCWGQNVVGQLGPPCGGADGCAVAQDALRMLGDDDMPTRAYLFPLHYEFAGVAAHSSSTTGVTCAVSFPGGALRCLGVIDAEVNSTDGVPLTVELGGAVVTGMMGCMPCHGADCHQCLVVDEAGGERVDTSGGLCHNGSAIYSLSCADAHSHSARHMGALPIIDSDGADNFTVRHAGGGVAGFRPHTDPIAVYDVALAASGRGPPVRSVARGDGYECAVTFDFRLMCWGDGGFGKLGYGDEDDVDASTFANLAYITFVDDMGEKAVKVTAVGETTFALLGNHCLYCWGNNERGLCGFSPGEGQSAQQRITTPARVVNLGNDPRVADVANTEWVACALMYSTAEVYCWGVATYIGVEDDAATNLEDANQAREPVHLHPSHIPVRLYGVGQRGMCAVLMDGACVCWGTTSFPGTEVIHLVPQLGGDADTGDGQSEMGAAPRPVDTNGRHVVSISSSASHACMLFEDGTVGCWGNNEGGWLSGVDGDGAIVSRGLWALLPFSVAHDGLFAIAVATTHSAENSATCVVVQTGQVHCVRRSQPNATHTPPIMVDTAATSACLPCGAGCGAAATLAHACTAERPHACVPCPIDAVTGLPNCETAVATAPPLPATTPTPPSTEPIDAPATTTQADVIPIFVGNATPPTGVGTTPPPTPPAYCLCCEYGTADIGCTMCPAGRYCPCTDDEKTDVLSLSGTIDCRGAESKNLRVYCPAGSVAPKQCPYFSFAVNGGFAATTSDHCQCEANYYKRSGINNVRFDVNWECSSCGGDNAQSPAGSAGVTSCSCVAGSFRNEENDDCAACPVRASSAPGATSVSGCQCQAGYYKADTSTAFNCPECPAGSYCQNGMRIKCEPSSSDASSTVTSAVASKAHSDCQCLAGYYREPGDSSESCTACPADSFCTGGTAQTKACPVGAAVRDVSGRDMHAACLCEDGMYLDVDAETCVECEGDAYCAGNDRSACPDGKGTDGVGRWHVANCTCTAPGKYWDEDRALCLTCTLEYYCEQGVRRRCPDSRARTRVPGANSSAQCECDAPYVPDGAGCVPPSASVLCARCATLRPRWANSSGCVCPAGTYGNAAALGAECAWCPAGGYCPGGFTALRIQCARGQTAPGNSTSRSACVTAQASVLATVTVGVSVPLDSVGDKTPEEVRVEVEDTFKDELPDEQAQTVMVVLLSRRRVLLRRLLNDNIELEVMFEAEVGDTEQYEQVEQSVGTAVQRTGFAGVTASMDATSDAFTGQSQEVQQSGTVGGGDGGGDGSADGDTDAEDDTDGLSTGVILGIAGGAVAVVVGGYYYYTSRGRSAPPQGGVGAQPPYMRMYNPNQQ